MTPQNEIDPVEKLEDVKQKKESSKPTYFEDKIIIAPSEDVRLSSLCSFSLNQCIS